MSGPISIPKEPLHTLCRKHGIQKLSLFGSVLRDDFGPESDVDILVQFEPDQVVGLRFITIQDELSDLLGRKVDLVTPNFLNRRIRKRILQEAQVQYEQG